MPVRFLIPGDKYLGAGVHIGTLEKTGQMERFIFRVCPDGLAVLDLHVVDNRIRVVGEFLANQKKMVVVSRKSVAHAAIRKFAEIVGAKAVCGRFMPGMLTNPGYKDFYEADVIFVVDPMADYQAVEESVRARVPLVAICNTYNETNNIDLILPANNKGHRSIAVLFWLLAREIQKERGTIKTYREFKPDIKDFYGKERYDQYREGREAGREGGRESEGGGRLGGRESAGRGRFAAGRGGRGGWSSRRGGRDRDRRGGRGGNRRGGRGRNRY